jgi:hypothetical protein
MGEERRGAARRGEERRGVARSGEEWRGEADWRVEEGRGGAGRGGVESTPLTYIKILFSDEIPGGARRHSIGIFLDLI